MVCLPGCLRKNWTYVLIFFVCFEFWVFVYFSYDGKVLHHINRENTYLQPTVATLGHSNQGTLLQHSLLSKYVNTSSDVMTVGKNETISGTYERQQQQLVKDKLFYNDTIVYQPEFDYIYSNSDLCTRNNNVHVFLTVLVPSKPGELLKRMAIRKTWGNVTHVAGQAVIVVFLLANSNDPTHKLFIHVENKAYRDICMKNFTDSYQNLTHKTIMGFQWVDEFCSDTEFVLKIDSDMIPNLSNLVRHLSALSRKSKTSPLGLFEGYSMRNIMPVRSTEGLSSKWFVSKDTYPHPTYPPYEIGAAYLISGDLVNPIVAISPHVKFFPFEDVYIGMIMKTLGIDRSY